MLFSLTNRGRLLYMINMLLALTEGETSGNYNAFIHSNYYCAMGILQDLWIDNHALQEEETTFFDNGLVGSPASLLQKGESTMNTAIKLNTETINESMTYSQWEKIHTQKQQKRKAERVYYIKQKLSGLTLAAIGIVMPILLDGDGTFSIIALPLGIYLLFTKQKVMMF